MGQTIWRLGLYSKVVLTVIAVCLVGLLVRQLPEKVEAKPERYGAVPVKVICTGYASLRGSLKVAVEYEKREGYPRIHPGEKELAEKVLKSPYASYDSVLQHVLAYNYAAGYRVKFVTDDFIILESE